jgi:5-hydroxyisourate hydrolase
MSNNLRKDGLVAISTRVSDSIHGRPAAGVAISLERRVDEGWRPVASGGTGRIGTVEEWPAPFDLEPGVYRLTFDIAGYFATLGLEAFYPEATTVFVVPELNRNYEVSLLIGPYSYATYCCSE